MNYEVLLFYKYVTIEDPETTAAWFRYLGSKYALTGRVLVAEEGINGTLEGTKEHTDAFVEEFHGDVRFADVFVKTSEGTGASFPKLKVKVREEIVGTKFPKHIDPRVKTAPRLTPEELREWYKSDKDFVVVDMRNDYEYQSGHFKGSINPGLDASRDLPQALPKLEALKDKTVLTVCTGGVRCEKMSAFLLENGFEDVYQLENGMHGYMEKYPGEDFLGTLYTFDNRLTMDFGGNREIVGTCSHCSEKTERYINCRNMYCHKHLLLCEACDDRASGACSPECQEVLSGVTAQ